MASLGLPTIVPGPNGLMQLAHRTRFGLQTSIENFAGLAEARDFLSLHRMRAVFEFDRVKLSDRECSLVVQLVVSAESVGALAKALKTSPAWVGKVARRLVTDGLLWIELDDKPARTVLGLTSNGTLIAKRLRGAK